jgi:hypothetical protein
MVAISLMVGSCTERPALPSATSVDVEAVQERLIELVQRLGGRREQRLAGELISYRVYQDGLVDCMADHGFVYRKPPFVDPTLALRDPVILHSEWLDPLDADLGLIWLGRAEAEVGERLRVAEQAVTEYEGLSPTEEGAFDDTLDGSCDNADNTAYLEANFPEGFFEESGALDALLMSIDEELDPFFLDDYRACMASRGVALERRSDAFNQLVYSPPFPDGGDVDEVAAWNAWVQEVEAFGKADVLCRRPAYEVGMALLEPRLAAFERTHRAALRSVFDAWDAMIERASGYPEFAESLAIERPSWPNWDGTV